MQDFVLLETLLWNIVSGWFKGFSPNEFHTRQFTNGKSHFINFIDS
jgi:hypothetical protein